jgi:hypothetical protein
MRSRLIIVVTAVASLMLVSQMAAADQVQEQLRLMEQRMAEMEDRLQATSDELVSAKSQVDEQQVMLSDAGMTDESDGGIRAQVGDFLEAVDVSGLVAASYNHRLIDSDIDDDLAGGNRLFRHPDANTFAVDQVWLTADKAPTEDSRGGFHFDYIAGQSADAQGGESQNEPYLFTGYVSYLSPIGNGVQIDLGRLGTPLGAEVLKTSDNFFVTQGNVWGLQPVTHTGIQLSTQVSDSVGVTFGVVNEVYSDTFTSTSNDKAYYGQVQISGDKYGLNIGGIIGDDTASGAGGNAGTRTSIVDVVATADPSDNVSLWANFDWVHSNGNDYPGHGDSFGFSAAGRFAMTDTMGIASRFEYTFQEDSLFVGASDDVEIISVTATLDKTLVEGLVGRLELRWDHSLEDSALEFAGGKENELVALAEAYYEF